MSTSPGGAGPSDTGELALQLFGVVENGLVLILNDAEVRVEWDAPEARRAAVVSAVASRSPKDVPQELAEALEAAGIGSGLVLDETREGRRSLAVAVRDVARGFVPTGWIWTHREGLYLSPGLGAEDRLSALRAFLGGLDTAVQLEAHAFQAARADTTMATASPPVDLVSLATEETARQEGAGILFATGNTIEAWSRSEIGSDFRIGRLSAICAVSGPRRIGRTGRFIASARHSCPNTRYAAEHGPQAKGVASTIRKAKAIAAAEAFERFCVGNLSGHRLQLAAWRDMENPALRADEVVEFAARQYDMDHGLVRFDDSIPMTWVEGVRGTSTIAVPAELVFMPIHEAGRRTLLTVPTSSGVAAGTSVDNAWRSALAELVERDAFMWTWLNRCQRERIEVAGRMEAIDHGIRALEGEGKLVTFVNLTLDLAPVVLCAIHSDNTLSLGAACRPDPMAAVQHAFDEAEALDAITPRLVPLATPSAVQTVEDHQAFHLARSGVENARFLFGADQAIELEDLGRSAAPLTELVRSISEPVLIPLTSPGRSRIAVVRALAPGLIPITFGYDREPLGVKRAQSDVAGFSSTLNPDATRLPHPFALSRASGATVAVG